MNSFLCSYVISLQLKSRNKINIITVNENLVFYWEYNGKYIETNEDIRTFHFDKRVPYNPT